MVESSSFGSEFVALRIAKEMLVAYDIRSECLACRLKDHVTYFVIIAVLSRM